MIRNDAISWWNGLSFCDKELIKEIFNYKYNIITGNYIQKFYEGVGDVFLKNKYNISNFDEFNKKYNNYKNNSEVIYQDKEWKIIKNPKSLKYIGKHSRGVIIYKTGDLYIENFSDYRIHNDILKILYDKNILKGTLKKNWGRKLPSESGFLTVQRYKNFIAVGESNKIIYDINDWEKYKNVYDELLKRCKSKNPDINFSNKLIGIKFKGLKKMSNKNKISENKININIIKNLI